MSTNNLLQSLLANNAKARSTSMFTQKNKYSNKEERSLSTDIQARTESNEKNELIDRKTTNKFT